VNSRPEHYLPLSLRFGSRRIICKNAVQQAAPIPHNANLTSPVTYRQANTRMPSKTPLSCRQRRGKKEIKPKHKSYHGRKKTKYKTSVSDVVLIVALDAIFHCTPCRKLHTPPSPLLLLLLLFLLIFLLLHSIFRSSSQGD